MRYVRLRHQGPLGGSRMNAGLRLRRPLPGEIIPGTSAKTTRKRTLIDISGQGTRGFIRPYASGTPVAADCCSCSQGERATWSAAPEPRPRWPPRHPDGTRCSSTMKIHVFCLELPSVAEYVDLRSSNLEPAKGQPDSTSPLAATVAGYQLSVESRIPGPPVPRKYHGRNRCAAW